jgi:hypothetical protein
VPPAAITPVDGRERRGGCDRGAADRGKAGAGRNRRDPEPAAQMSDEPVGGPEKFTAHAGIADQRAHQQEHRNHAERIVRHGPHRGLADQLQRRRETNQIAKAGDADEAHRHADRHAQQHQREQRDKSEDGDSIGAHAVYSTVLILGSCI